LYSFGTLAHDLPGHFLSYSVGITEDGEVLELPRSEWNTTLILRIKFLARNLKPLAKEEGQ